MHDDHEQPPTTSPFSPSVQRLLDVVAQLRDPENGCPWDKKQTHASMAHFAVEEAYEVVETIERGEEGDTLRDELGDLLLQVVFHAQIARERGAFTFDDVAESISAKMIRRHPHVFAEADPDEALAAWERDKKRDGRTSLLDGLPRALPALQRAQRMTARAATVGFDWPTPPEVLAKVDEEIEELKEALQTHNPQAIEDELGDVLFSLVNLARKLDIDAEGSLRRTMSKFTRRFQAIERAVESRGTTLEETSLEEMDQLWNDAKKEE